MKKSITLAILKESLEHKKLLKLGFKESKVSGSAVVYFKQGCRYIVKRNVFVNWPPKNLKIAKFIVYPNYEKDDWIIQKRINTKDGYKASLLIAKKLKLYQGEHDMHEQNCGFINKKPVCFDPYYEPDTY